MVYFLKATVLVNANLRKDVHMTQLTYIPIILLSVIVNAVAQLFLKQGMIKMGYFEFSFGSILKMIFSSVTNIYIMGGLVCYAISLVLWMMTLSRVDVGFAYPLMSIGFIVTALAGYWFFGESLTFSRILGITLIMLGVYLVSRS